MGGGQLPLGPGLVPRYGSAQLLVVPLRCSSPPSLEIALSVSLHVAASRDTGGVDGKEQLPGIEKKQRFQNLVRCIQPGPGWEFPTPF